MIETRKSIKLKPKQVKLEMRLLKPLQTARDEMMETL
jgi:hypothetical protein